MKPKFLLGCFILAVALLTPKSGGQEENGLTACFQWACTCSGVCSFDGRCSTGSIENYGWTFDDGDFGAGAVIQHVYAEPGTYDVTLWVTRGSKWGGFEGDSEHHLVTVGCS